MRSIHRGAIWTFSILSAVLTLGLPGSPSSAAPSTASPGPSWSLVDYQQRICVDAEYGRRTYFIIFIAGAWRAPVQIGAQGLPAGSGSSSVTLPPGSGDGHTAVAGVSVDIPPTAPGIHSAQLWASDGTVKQSVPATIDVRARC